MYFCGGTQFSEDEIFKSDCLVTTNACLLLPTFATDNDDHRPMQWHLPTRRRVIGSPDGRQQAWGSYLYDVRSGREVSKKQIE